MGESVKPLEADEAENLDVTQMIGGADEQTVKVHLYWMKHACLTPLK